MLGDEFHVDTASTGQEAVQLLATNAYALIVSDMRMPDMCGTALLAHAFDNYPGTARMLLTARCDVEVQDSMFALLLKPCTSAQLTQTIKDAICWSKVNRVASHGVIAP